MSHSPRPRFCNGEELGKRRTRHGSEKLSSNPTTYSSVAWICHDTRGVELTARSVKLAEFGMSLLQIASPFSLKASSKEFSMFMPKHT